MNDKHITHQENVAKRPTPLDFIHVSSVGGKYTVAQRNVLEVAGERAERLMHTFESSNTTKAEKARAARRFLAMTGIHPQAIHDEIMRINSEWFHSGATSTATSV